MVQKNKKLSLFLIILTALIIGFLGKYLSGFKYGINFERQNVTN